MVSPAKAILAACEMVRKGFKAEPSLLSLPFLATGYSFAEDMWQPNHRATSRQYRILLIGFNASGFSTIVKLQLSADGSPSATLCQVDFQLIGFCHLFNNPLIIIAADIGIDSILHDLQLVVSFTKKGEVHIQ